MAEGKKRDGLLIAVIVLIIIAIVFYIIAIGILFGYGNREDLEPQRGQLLGAGGLVSTAVPAAIVAAVLSGLLVKARSEGKESKGLYWATIITGVVTVTLIIIAAIIIFVTANQVAETNPDEATGLRFSGIFLILGFLVFIVSWFIFIFRARKKLPKDVRKARTKAFFTKRGKETGKAGAKLQASSDTAALLRSIDADE